MTRSVQWRARAVQCAEMAGDAGAAQRRWELENDAAQPVDAVADSYYQYDLAEQQQLQREKPWSKDPHYFKRRAPPLSRHSSLVIPCDTICTLLGLSLLVCVAASARDIASCVLAFFSPHACALRHVCSWPRARQHLHNSMLSLSVA